MLKWVIMILALYFLYRLVSNEIAVKKIEHPDNDRKTSQEKTDIGEMVEDPVCGIYVTPESAIKVRDGQILYYFCSYECRDKFLKSRGITPDSIT